MKLSTIKFWLTASIISSLPIFGGVKASAEKVRVSGYFENFSEKELLAYKGKLKVVPEYAPSSGVMMAYDIIKDYQLAHLFEEILKQDQQLQLIIAITAQDERQAKSYFANLCRRLNISPSRITYFKMPKADDGDFDTSFSWLRDWGPWTVAYDNGHKVEPRFVEWNYFGEDRSLADRAPEALSKQLNIPRISLPLRFEGGNFMTNSKGVCVMTNGTFAPERTFKYQIAAVNDQRRYVEDLRAEASAIKNKAQRRDLDQYRSSAERFLSRDEKLLKMSKTSSVRDVRAMFRDYIGCKKLIVLDPSPADYVQHIDLFAKFVSDDTVLVAELEDQTIRMVANQDHRSPYHKAFMDFLVQVRDHLNRSTKVLRRAGLKVIRVPLPLPYAYTDNIAADMAGRLPHTYKIGGDDGLGNLHMRTYINSLILNQKVYIPRFKSPETGGDTAPLIYGFPQYGKAKSSYPDAALLPYYEEKVKAAYASAGLEPVFIDADLTPYAWGSIHCLTMQMGKVP